MMERPLSEEEQEQELYLRLETRSLCKLTRRSPNAVARHRLPSGTQSLSQALQSSVEARPPPPPSRCRINTKSKNRIALVEEEEEEIYLRLETRSQERLQNNEATPRRHRASPT